MTKLSWNPSDMVTKSRFIRLWDELSEDTRQHVLTVMRRLLDENPERLENNATIYGHLCNLFFSLALLEVEGEQGIPEQQTLDKLANCMYEYVQPQRKQMQRLFSYRWLWPVMRVVIPKALVGTNGPNFECVPQPSDNKARVEVDTVKCPFKDLPERYGHPKLGPLFCQVDDIIYGDLPCVAFLRKGTLARGDDRCDFVFELKQKK